MFILIPKELQSDPSVEYVYSALTYRTVLLYDKITPVLETMDGVTCSGFLFRAQTNNIELPDPHPHVGAAAISPTSVPALTYHLKQGTRGRPLTKTQATAADLVLSYSPVFDPNRFFLLIRATDSGYTLQCYNYIRSTMSKTSDSEASNLEVLLSPVIPKSLEGMHISFLLDRGWELHLVNVSPLYPAPEGEPASAGVFQADCVLKIHKDAVEEIGEPPINEWYSQSGTPIGIMAFCMCEGASFSTATLRLQMVECVDLPEGHRAYLLKFNFQLDL